jgi:hypothetical protein
MRVLVSLANIMMSEILLVGMEKLLIYVVKSNGPKTELCETPCLIDFQLEKQF